MVRVFASSVVDHGFEPRSGQTNDYKIGICCFSAKHAALRRQNKDWSVRNQNASNVSEWSDMSTHGLLFQSVNTINIKLSVLAQNKADLIIVSLKFKLFSPWYSWKIAELALKNNHSLTLIPIYQSCLLFVIPVSDIISKRLHFIPPPAKKQQIIVNKSINLKIM